MKTTDLNTIQEAVISAARGAGRLIMEKRGKEFQIINKSDSSSYKEVGESLASQVVTEIDYLSQAYILEHISPVVERYDLALLAEESDDDGSRFVQDYFICIDPLDGTLPFTEGKSGFSISIGLISRSGIPVIGVVYDPYNDVLYSAIKGQGAYRNSAAFHVETQKKQRLTLMTDRSFLAQKFYDEIMEEVRAIAVAHGYESVEVVTEAGAALNACWVAEKAPALYFKHPKKSPGGGSIWDFGAAACIVSEAKAFVSNIYGDALDLNRKGSSFMNHEGVLFASVVPLAQAVISRLSKFSLSE